MDTDEQEEYIGMIERKIINDHPKNRKGRLIYKLSNGNKIGIEYMYGGKYRVRKLFKRGKKKKVKDLDILADPKTVGKIIFNERMKVEKSYKNLNKF